MTPQEIGDYLIQFREKLTLKNGLPPGDLDIFSVSEYCLHTRIANERNIQGVYEFVDYNPVKKTYTHINPKLFRGVVEFLQRTDNHHLIREFQDNLG